MGNRRIPSARRRLCRRARQARSRAGGKHQPVQGGGLILAAEPPFRRKSAMNGIVYLVGLVVVVLAILSFIGLR